MNLALLQAIMKQASGASLALDPYSVSSEFGSAPAQFWPRLPSPVSDSLEFLTITLYI